MKKSIILIVTVCLLFTVVSVNAEVFKPVGPAFFNGPGFHGIIPIPGDSRANPGGTSALWLNPAGIGVNGGSGLLISRPLAENDMDETWGIGINLGGFGFGLEADRNGYVTMPNGANRITWASSMKISDGMYLGWAYHYSSGLNRQNSWDLGLLTRPTKWMSFGVQVTDINNPDMEMLDNTNSLIVESIFPSYHLGLAVRPFKHHLTLSADVTLWRSEENWESGENKYGENMDPTFIAEYQPVPSVGIRAGYSLDSEMIFGGLSFYTGHAELGGDIRSREAGENESGYMGSDWLRLSSEYRPSLSSIFKKNKVVRMNLAGRVAEEPRGFSFFHPRQMTTLQILNRINQLTKDDEIAGLVLNIDGFAMSFSDREELREALLKFKASGKKLAVYAENYGLGNYYLASCADLILLHPAGGVDVHGLSATMPYFKDILEKVGIEAQVINVGKYKSAGEVFSRDGMSDPARESLDAVIETIWQILKEDIAEGRDVSKDDVEAWVNEALFTADQALEAGMVDKLVFKDEINKEVEDLFKTYGKPNFVSSVYYFMQEPAELEWEDMTSPKIAIVYATGSIVTGESAVSPFGGGKTMGSKTISQAIMNARSDPRVKAIVFRIDSGGGSALASDIILREIERTVNDSLNNGRNIPVVVSMSDVAGSGGYYIACKADTIVATRSCITGSIGVLGIKPVLKDLYEKAGISHDGVTRGEHATMWSTTRRWDEKEEELLKSSMENTYERFVGFVAEGRNIDTSRVHELGQGRIWSGEDALSNGLVDVNGGLCTSIEIAKQMAGIETDEVVITDIYPKPIGFNLANEIKYSAIRTLPKSVQELLKAEDFIRAVDAGEPLLLMPLEEDIIEE